MPRYSTEFDESNAERDKQDLTLSDFEVKQTMRQAELREKGFYDSIPLGLATGYRFGSNQYDPELARKHRAILREANGLAKLLESVTKDILREKRLEGEV